MSAHASLPLAAAGAAPSRRRARARDVSRRASSDPSSSKGGEASAPKSRLDPENFVEVALSPEDLVRAQYKDNAAESMGDSILGGQSIVTGTTEEMKDLVPFGADNLTVLRATKQYAEAFEAGRDPGQVVAQTLGVDSLANLSPAQRVYAEKVRAKLEENAQRMRGYTLEAQRLYKKGIYAYSKGMYPDSVKWQEAALAETDPDSKLGGDIQIQMALGYYAFGQKEAAIEIYERLIALHPERSVKKQAEELKYITEAPQMEIGEDEKVQVPLLRDEYGGYRDKWGTSGKVNSNKAGKEKSLEELYGEEAEPIIRLPQNPLITVAGSVIALGIAAYSATLAR
jgi:RNA exonuclease 1